MDQYPLTLVAIGYTVTATIKRGKKNRQRLRISSRSFLFPLLLPVLAPLVSRVFHLRTTALATDEQNFLMPIVRLVVCRTIDNQ
jgi:hypothetical protein